MYLLKITITDSPVDEEKLARHRQWFKDNFAAGHSQLSDHSLILKQQV